MKKKVSLYSDGGAVPNPGKGGFGVILECGNYIKEFSQGYELTTNNRMELMAIIFGLEHLKPEMEVEVEVFSDSKYVVEAVNKGWARKWKRNNWYRNKKERAENIDLWKKLLVLLDNYEVKFTWVKGHNGHIQNERCDFLATSAINSKEFLKDEGYKNPPQKEKTLFN